MSKPTSKSEAKWLFWREENPKHGERGFTKFAKTKMNRLKRRFFKQEDGKEDN